MSISPLFIGVDIGTGSVRAGLFSLNGDLLQLSVKDIEVNNPEPGVYQQDSEEIWSAVCITVQEILIKHSNKDIVAISFCATCSLVAIGFDEKPTSVCKSGTPKWNIVMWMDHRAKEEAAFINTTKHSVLSNLGGSISLEMHTPKLLWLKNNLNVSFKKTKHFFDLSDYLRWRATGSFKRSICTLVAKFTFVHGTNAKDKTSVCSWDESYFEEIGLTDALPKLGRLVSLPGDYDSISEDSAKNLGLDSKTQVGFSLIDAHSGVLGIIACGSSQDDSFDALLTSRLALICGTSTCILALSKESINVNGVWGPYLGVILNGFYLAEGGQSVSGKLVDHIVTSHLAYGELLTEFGNHSVVLTKLEDILAHLVPLGSTDCSHLTKHLHIWPDFHGNRSPIADPTLRGTITGLSLSSSREDLAILYLATIQALAYGCRHVKERMENSGYTFQEVVMCGGLAKSKLYRSIHADILGIPVVEPSCKESVLLGSAMSAAGAYFNSTLTRNQNEHMTLENILFKMGGPCVRILPNTNSNEFHEKKYQVFLRMLNDQLDYREIMTMDMQK